MKKYKFVSEDENMFHVEHPDGSTFAIAKSAVGPGVHKQIKALEPVKMAEGGEVDDTPAQAVIEEPVAAQPSGPVGPVGAGEMGDLSQYFQAPQSAPEAIGSAGPGMAPAPIRTPAQDEAQQAMLPESQPMAAEQPTPQTAMNQAQMGALNAKENAIKQAGAVQAGTFQQEANTFDKLAQDQMKVDQESAKTLEPLRARSQELFNGIQNGTVDHNRLYHNMGTGNKILAAISVALSGLGSGLTGKPNIAMDVIQKSIDRDIESQKIDIGKKQNLFSENLRLIGDEKAAAMATKAQLLSSAQAKIQSFAAQRGSAQANLQSQVMMTDLQIQKQQLEQKASMYALASKGGDVNPAALVPHLVPGPHQESVYKELERAMNTKKYHDQIMQNFDQAAADMRGAGRVGSIIKTPRSLGALDQSLQPTFSDIDHTVREAAMNHARDNIMPSKFDTDADTRTRRNALEGYLTSKSSAPRAKSFGIDLDRFGSTGIQKTGAPVARQTSDDRTALFDSNTKQFLRYQ